MLDILPLLLNHFDANIGHFRDFSNHKFERAAKGAAIVSKASCETWKGVYVAQNKYTGILASSIRMKWLYSYIYDNECRHQYQKHSN